MNKLKQIMKHYFMAILGLVSSSTTFAQKSDSITTINKIFSLQVDSIERKIAVNKSGNDTSYYIHYTVKNISKDTQTYVINSCFYYNHYSLKVGQLEFDINPSGGCSFNETIPHSLAPGESLSKSEWIIAINLNTLTEGELVVRLSIPLVKDNEKTYRVDGRTFVENKEYCIFFAQTKIIETKIYTKKRKKNNT